MKWFARFGTVMAIVALAVALAGVAVPVGLAARAQAAVDPVVVVTFGDSTSVSGIWQNELCRQVTLNTGQVCQVRKYAEGGVDCGYWDSRVVPALNANPDVDLVILACGTNNQVLNAGQAENLGTQFRLFVEAARTWRTPAVQIVPTLIQYSDWYAVPSDLLWLLDSEPRVNDELYRNMQYYLPAGWFGTPAAVIDWQQVPAGAPYLDGGGVHATDLGQIREGRIAYDRIAPSRGWPTSSEPKPCDMSGHRPHTARPAGVIACKPFEPVSP